MKDGKEERRNDTGKGDMLSGNGSARPSIDRSETNSGTQTPIPLERTPSSGASVLPLPVASVADGSLDPAAKKIRNLSKKVGLSVA